MRGLVAVIVLIGCGDNITYHPPDAAPDAPRPPGTCPASGTNINLRLLAQTEATVNHITAPADDDRLFIVQGRGTIMILDHGQLLPEPFLDVRTGISPPFTGGSGQELGLLGLTFHPDFATNGTFFVNYTAANTGDPSNPYLDVTMRMQVSASDRNRADPSTAAVLLAIPDFAANHNGGMLDFGLDGDLYVGTGDGGFGGDPQLNGQNTHALLGKILRVDVDHRLAGMEYAIPADNPFADGIGGAPEVFITGVRNPWRFTFDRATGDLWIGDVGQGAFEEVDVLRAGQQAGANLGWSMYEGNTCYHPPCDPTGLVFPKDVRTHATDGWCAVIGGEVYRGACYPDLVGEYFYTDHCRGGLSRAKLVGDTLEVVDLANELPYNPTTIHADGHGELYIADLFGNVFQLEAIP